MDILIRVTELVGMAGGPVAGPFPGTSVGKPHLLPNELGIEPLFEMWIGFIPGPIYNLTTIRANRWF